MRNKMLNAKGLERWCQRGLAKSVCGSCGPLRLQWREIRLRWHRIISPRRLWMKHVKSRWVPRICHNKNLFHRSFLHHFIAWSRPIATDCRFIAQMGQCCSNSHEVWLFSPFPCRLLCNLHCPCLWQASQENRIKHCFRSLQDFFKGWSEWLNVYWMYSSALHAASAKFGTCFYLSHMHMISTFPNGSRIQKLCFWPLRAPNTSGGYGAARARNKGDMLGTWGAWGLSTFKPNETTVNSWAVQKHRRIQVATVQGT